LLGIGGSFRNALTMQVEGDVRCSIGPISHGGNLWENCWSAH
jgi:hypothetical protein